jgi:hypothetical protein
VIHPSFVWGVGKRRLWAIYFCLAVSIRVCHEMITKDLINLHLK